MSREPRETSYSIPAWAQANISGLRYQSLPPVVRKAIGLLSRLSALVVLVWMLYVTYQQRDILFAALSLQPWYVLPFVACYVVGFTLAVVSWHLLMRLLGARYSFFNDYAMYTYMSAYRYLPVPYSSYASLFYNYHRMGTGYRATGLAIVMTSVLHIVAGLLAFCGSLLYGVNLVPDGYIVAAVIGGSIAALALHPAVFTRLVRLRSGSDEQVALPPITWQTIVLLVSLNVMVLLLGGGALYFAALMIMDVPPILLPVCIGTWGLMVSTLNMLAWLPADFGATRAIFVLLLQNYMPVALATAFFATWRIGMVVLDLGNAGIVLLIRTCCKGRSGLDTLHSDEK